MHTCLPFNPEVSSSLPLDTNNIPGHNFLKSLPTFGFKVVLRVASSSSSILCSERFFLSSSSLSELLITTLWRCHLSFYVPKLVQHFIIWPLIFNLNKKGLSTLFCLPYFFCRKVMSYVKLIWCVIGFKFFPNYCCALIGWFCSLLIVIMCHSTNFTKFLQQS